MALPAEQKLTVVLARKLLPTTAHGVKRWHSCKRTATSAKNQR
jgi:hypothetical protein